jgi:hypothetical protein
VRKIVGRAHHLRNVPINAGEEEMTREQEHLDEANQHIRETEERIANQEAIVRKLATDGHDTRRAENLLQIFRNLLASLKEHRDSINSNMNQR